MIAIVDYGVNNLRSVQKALEHVGAEAVVTDEKPIIRDSQGVILPGVGAFGDAMEILQRTGLDEAVLDVAERKVPLLGICLGMQLLFDESEEMGVHRGLGILPGRIVRFPTDLGLPVPHIGWNQLHPRREHVLTDGVNDGEFAYFVHSYYALPADEEIVLATTDYGIDFVSIFGSGHLFGAQFHPEKSQNIGLKLLANFAKVVGES